MSSSVEESTTEYAVEVTGVGWVLSGNPVIITVGAERPTVFESEALALECKERVEREYRRLGLPDVAERVVVVTRQVVVTRTAWLLP